MPAVQLRWIFEFVGTVIEEGRVYLWLEKN